MLEEHHVGGIRFTFILISIAICFLILAAGLEIPRLLEEKKESKIVNASFEEGKVEIGYVPVRVLLADTSIKRSKGLSGFDGLSDKQGMYFIFPKNDQQKIWMKDMKFDLDIIWINSSFQIVHIEENVSKDSYPKVYTTSRPSKYVLEVPAGFVQRYTITESSYFQELQ